eukprot:1140461-Rhodomonas_salina.2
MDGARVTEMQASPYPLSGTDLALRATMSGTDLAVRAAICYPVCPVLCYGISGTEPAYRATICCGMSETVLWDVRY